MEISFSVLDISSRYVPGWLVANAEDTVVAKDFLADAVARNRLFAVSSGLLSVRARKGLLSVMTCRCAEH